MSLSSFQQNPCQEKSREAEKCREPGLPHPHPPQSPFPPRGTQLELEPCCSSLSSSCCRDSLEKQLPPFCAKQGCSHSRLFPLLARQALSQTPPEGGPLPALFCFQADFAACCSHRCFWHHFHSGQAVSPSSSTCSWFFHHCNSSSASEPWQGWASSQAAEILITGSPSNFNHSHGVLQIAGSDEECTSSPTAEQRQPWEKQNATRAEGSGLWQPLQCLRCDVHHHFQLLTAHRCTAAGWMNRCLPCRE